MPPGCRATVTAGNAQFSADGRYVVFESDASNLVAGDSNNANWDIFVKDLQSGAIQRVSTDAAGVQGNDSSCNAQFSADGRTVVFESYASNLVNGDSNGANDVFVKDLQSGAIQRVSTDAAGAQGNGGSYNAQFSADGRYVVFESGASNLVAGDSNGMRDVFVKDLQSGAIQRVSTDAAGVQGNGAATSAQFSADGRYVVFESDASNLVAGDSNGTIDIFVKDLQSGAIQRVSTDAAGVQGNSHSSSNAQFSADGRYRGLRKLWPATWCRRQQ
jgi:Tol biopolymer transport system component